MLIILFLVSHFNFLFVPWGRLSWLPVSFLLHIKYPLSYSYRIVSHLLQNSARTNSKNDHLINVHLLQINTCVTNVIMRLIFTFVPNWRCFKLSSEDSVSTFFGCFCFWSWWLWSAGRWLPLMFMNRILSLQFYLVSSSSAGPWPGALLCNCETLIMAMATQTHFPKGCLSSLQT